MPPSLPTGFWSTLINNAKNLVQIIAVLGAGAWAVVTFIFPEDLRPDDYRPFLVVQSTVESLQNFPDYTSLTLRSSVVNSSTRYLRILAGHYDLIGFEQEIPLARADTGELVKKLNQKPDHLFYSHGETRRNCGSISIGRIIPDDWSLAPEEEYTSQVVIPIPQHIDVVQANSIVYYNYADSHVFNVEWIDENGQVWYQTQVLEGDTFVEHKPKENPDHKEMEEEHGLFWSWSQIEIDSSTPDTEAAQFEQSCWKGGGK